MKRTSLTDLPSVVEGVLRQNITQNSTSLTENGWHRVIGPQGGLARAVALNWEKPMDCHHLTASEKYIDAVDVIIAAECIWLADLLDCFCETLNILFEREKKLRSRTPQCFIVAATEVEKFKSENFRQRRDGRSSVQ